MKTYDYGSQEAKNSCVYFLFFSYTHLLWSTWGTVLQARSRYSTIRNPLAPGVTTRKAAIASAVTCAIGIVVAVPPLFTWAKYTLIYSIKDGYYDEVCVVDFSNLINYISLLLSQSPALRKHHLLSRGNAEISHSKRN